MPAVPINIGPITGDTATAVSVVTLLRGDTNTAPAGVTLPIALALSGSLWGGSFTESSPAAYYLATYTVTFSDGGMVGPYALVVSGEASSAIGFWTNQTNIERFIGQQLGANLSNVNQNSNIADPSGYADAIAYAESFINYQLSLFGYPTGVTSPAFPTPSFAYAAFNNAATILAAYWLYVKRGIFDDKDKAGGKFAKLKEDAETEIKAIVRNKIPDVARNFKQGPAVILGRGRMNTNQPASTIGQVP